MQDRRAQPIHVGAERCLIERDRGLLYVLRQRDLNLEFAINSIYSETRRRWRRFGLHSSRRIVLKSIQDSKPSIIKGKLMCYSNQQPPHIFRIAHSSIDTLSTNRNRHRKHSTTSSLVISP